MWYDLYYDWHYWAILVDSAIIIEIMFVLLWYFLQFVQADTNQVVRSKMVEAGVAIIDKQGSENVGLLLPILENYLDKKVWYSFSSC